MFYGLINSLVGFIASILPMIVVFGAASSLVPDRIFKVKFDDGSYFEIEDYTDGRLCKSIVKFHNANGSTPTYSDTYYLSQEEKVRNQFKK